MKRTRHQIAPVLRAAPDQCLTAAEVQSPATQQVSAPQSELHTRRLDVARDQLDEAGGRLARVVTAFDGMAAEAGLDAAVHFVAEFYRSGQLREYILDCARPLAEVRRQLLALRFIETNE